MENGSEALIQPMVVDNSDQVLEDVRRRWSSVDEFLDSFPPGIRFIPTDEELVCHYLINKVLNKPMSPNRIYEVDIYNYNPEQLAEMFCKPGEEKVMYFFSRLVRKNQNGSGRPSRSAGDGYWRTSRGDRPIPDKGPTIGFAKSLVYYKGKPAKDAARSKTNYLMHEYIINKKLNILPTTAPPIKLDDWVLCKIYEKVEKVGNRNEQHIPSNTANIPNEGCLNIPFPTSPPNQQLLPQLVNTSTFTPNDAAGSVGGFLENDCLLISEDMNLSYTVPNEASLLPSHELPPLIDSFDPTTFAPNDAAGSVGGFLENDCLLISEDTINLSYTLPNEVSILLPSHELPPLIDSTTFDPTYDQMSNTALQFHSSRQSSTFGHDDLLLNDTIPDFSDHGSTAQLLSRAEILEILELLDSDFSSPPREGCPVDIGSLNTVPDGNIIPCESHTCP